MYLCDTSIYPCSPVCVLTVFAGLDVQHVAADTVTSLGVSQHLDAVVGELLQSVQLHLLPHGGDVLHLSPLWRVDEFTKFTHGQER